MKMLWTEKDKDGTVFVIWRGKLIYKRWPNGTSAIMDKYSDPRFWKRNPKFN